MHAFHVDFEAATITGYAGQESDTARIVKYATFPVDVKWDVDMLAGEIQKTQTGSTFTEMALGLIAAGVVNYTVDLPKRKVLFRSATGETYEWSIPNPGYPPPGSDSSSEPSKSPGGA